MYYDFSNLWNHLFDKAGVLKMDKKSIYTKGKIFGPYEDDAEQDLWVGEIDYIDHIACVEVRAVSRGLLETRMSSIIDVLNGVGR